MKILITIDFARYLVGLGLAMLLSGCGGSAQEVTNSSSSQPPANSSAASTNVNPASSSAISSRASSLSASSVSSSTASSVVNISSSSASLSSNALLASSASSFSSQSSAQNPVSSSSIAVSSSSATLSASSSSVTLTSSSVQSSSSFSSFSSSSSSNSALSSSSTVSSSVASNSVSSSSSSSSEILSSSVSSSAASSSSSVLTTPSSRQLEKSLTHVVNGVSTRIRFLEYLPADYATSTKTYPLIIFAHGAGETSKNDSQTADSTEYARLRIHGPPKHIVQNHNMCFTVGGEESCFIVIAPQTPQVDDWWAVHRLRAVVDHAKANLRVDSSRIYFTGLSMGGGATWSFARSQRYNPNEFYAAELAAIVPICGAAEVNPSSCNLANQSLPIWAFHGTADGTVSISNSRNFVNAINGILAGGVQCAPNPVQALLTEYAGVGHDSWTRTYNPENRFNPVTAIEDFSGINIYQWMLSHSR